MEVLSASFISKQGEGMECYPVPDGRIEEMKIMSDDRFGFNLWSPIADAVVVNIYEYGEGGQPLYTHELSLSDDGVWRSELIGDWKGKFYTFQVHVNNKWLDETPGIFAKAVGVNGGRAQILDLKSTDPDGWGDDKAPELSSYSDIVLYEMHHRDYSADISSGIRHRGRYLALTERGTHTDDDYATGIDHLIQLGITHVHLLPSYDFGSIDESIVETCVQYDSQDSLATNKDETNTHQYNWGYDPVNYNVPEGSYSTDPFTPAVRIREMKQMVMALHRAGMRVVMDVVYNHVYDVAKSSFENTVPGYFFRRKDDGTLANGSGCGSETASERLMMRKYMIESVLYWIEEYHIDGFRFDLMGIHDIDTMNAIREAVDAIDPSIFIYGEGWAAEPPLLPEDRLAMKANATRLRGIAVFCDEMRDALRGGWNDKDGAFLIGEPGHEESLKYGVVGAIEHPEIDMRKVNYSTMAWAKQPTQMISYVSCHDDLCLADRLKLTLIEKYAKSNSSATDIDTELVRLHKLAETAVLTSQGVPFVWCGDEMMRSKKGVRNSYNSPDSINAIDWNDKSRHIDVCEYVSGLIAMRRSHAAFRMGNADDVVRNIHFLTVSRPNVVAYTIDGTAVGDDWHHVVVVLNANKRAVSVNLQERASYTVVCKDGVIDASGLATFCGRRLRVSAQSALIMYKD